MNGRPFPKGHKINVGIKHSREWNEKVGLANKGKHFGKLSEEHKRRISITCKKVGIGKWTKNYIPWNKGIKYSDKMRDVCRKGQLGTKKPWVGERCKKLIGELAPNWKGGIRKKKHERNDSAYNQWRLFIWRRDGFKCKIGNQDCKGKIKAHHILSWKNYPELRYNINNGITLCQAHHPLRRAEEKRLIPFFQGLVSVSNTLI